MMKFREAQKELIKNGFVLNRVKGSHYIYRCKTNPKVELPIPFHGNEINKKVEGNLKCLIKKLKERSIR